MDDDGVVELLGRVVESLDGGAAAQLEGLAKSQELRDVDWTGDARLGAALGAALCRALRDRSAPSPAARSVVAAAAAVLAFPELSGETDEAASCRAAVLCCGAGDAAVARLEAGGEEPALEALVLGAYRCGGAAERGRLRQALCALLLRAAAEAGEAGVAPQQAEAHWAPSRRALAVLLPLAGGLRAPLSPADEQLLLEVLVPLHNARGKTSPSESALGLLHRPLSRAVLVLVDKAPGLLASVVERLLALWPTAREGNSPREVLLLHGLEALLASTAAQQWRTQPQPPEVRSLLGKVCARLGECSSSENSAVCERALLFWSNDPVSELLLPAAGIAGAARPASAEGGGSAARAGAAVLRPLLRHALVHWNKTVTVMAAAALRRLGARSPALAALALELCAEAFPEWPPAARAANLERLQAALLEDEAAASAPPRAAAAAAAATVPRKQDLGFMNMVLGEELGRGSFSKVFLALRVERGRPQSQWPRFALKRMELRHRDVALREAAAMDRVTHPNCSRLVGLYESGGSINLVVELAEQGDLHSLVQRVGPLDRRSAAFCAAEVCAALEAVHAAGLLFGDLKPENVLVHANGHVKLGDFGATRELADAARGGADLEGTLCYLAPELFARRRAPHQEQRPARAEHQEQRPARPPPPAAAFALQRPEAIDWWAFGCLLFFLLTGRPPLWVDEERDLVQALVAFKVERYPPGFPDLAQELVAALLQRDPAHRLATAAHVGAHPFFTHEMEPGGLSYRDAHAQPAPQAARGAVAPDKGPWTQRTYSMMHSPLPKRYDDEAIDATEILHELAGERDLPWRPAKDALTARPHKLAQEQRALQPPAVTTTRSSFNPTTLLPASRTSSAPAPSAAQSDPKQQAKSKYAFKGLDLSAG